MYPIAVTGAIAVIRKDYNYVIYVLPLSILGIFISSYHYGIQKGIINIESDHFAGEYHVLDNILIGLTLLQFHSLH